jgi:hypothetical protein
MTDDPVFAVVNFLSATLRNLLIGAIVVATTWFAARRVSVLTLLAAVLLGVVATTLIRFGTPSAWNTYDFGQSPATSLRIRVSPLYMAWLDLLYGGLFACAVALILRVQRTRAALTRAELARSQIETLLAQAELSNLRGAVDPAFLLRVLDEALRRQVDAAQPDGLLERLVDFLRVAMRGSARADARLSARNWG